MAEYEIRISGVHYAANGDSVAGQKDTEEMHMRTRELLSRIDRVRPIVTLSPAPENHVHERAIQARALGKRIGRVALECVDLVWDLLRASGMPMLLAKVKEVAVRNHGYAVVTVSAEALQQTQPTVASETEWGPWLSDLPLLPPSEQLQAEEEAAFVLENVFFPKLNECDVHELATYVNIWLEGSLHDLSREARQKRVLYGDIGQMDVVLSRLYYLNTPRKAFQSIMALLMMRCLTCRELGIDMRPMTEDEYERDGIIKNPLDIPTTIARVVAFGATRCNDSQKQTIELLVHWLRDDYEQSHCEEIESLAADTQVRLANAIEKAANKPATQHIYGDKNEFQGGAQLLKMGLPEEFTIDDVMRCFGLAQNNSVRARVFRLQKDGLVEKVDEFVDNGTTKAKYKKTGAVMI